MKRKWIGLPQGATGIYRLDCASSPPMFEEGEMLIVGKLGPPGHSYVHGASGKEGIIRNSEILLDEQFAMFQVPLPGGSLHRSLCPVT